MTEDLLTRARELAVYIIETRTTIRQAAKHFGLSKSTVHKDLAARLPAALVFTGLFPASGEGPALFVQTAKNL